MKGILFKPDMIKATVREIDPKAVTRRLAGLKEINQEPDKWAVVCSLSNPGKEFDFYKPLCMSLPAIVIKPRYQVGETVYIKEAHVIDIPPNNNISVYYPIDGQIRVLDHWSHEYCSELSNGQRWYGQWKVKSPLFMPAWAARYFIKITDVRAEKLNTMTDGDANKEGVDNLVTFMLLWDSINARGGYEWTKNCWVWVYEFQRVWFSRQSQA